VTVRGTSGQRGQALTELALLSVVLIIVMLGAVDLARVFQFSTALQEAAREGARHASWYEPTTDKNPFIAGYPSDVTTSPTVDTSIAAQISTVLKGAGLLNAGQTLVTTGGTCPASSGAAPLDASHVNAYVCIDSTAPSGVKCTTANGGHDVEVFVVERFGLIVQTSILGFDPNFPVTGDAHMRVQGC